MKLTKVDIEEFRTIYRQEFGEELSDADAERRSRQLLMFYDVIYQILLKDQRREFRVPSDPVFDESAQGGKLK